MDSNRRPQSSDGLRVAPTSQDAPRRSVSPSSHPAANPATPGAVGETADSYFQPLRETPSVAPSVAPSIAPSIAPSDAPSVAPSIRSRFSRLSLHPSSQRQSAGGSVQRPTIDQGRLPSIRIRRRSNVSLASASSGHIPFPALPGEEFDYHDEFEGGRPRSISQPERARLHDNANLARHSRRVPQIAMPRLTEEGARPSLAELGVAATPPLSPTQSLPEHTSNRAQDEPVPRKRLQRARNVSRFFWPGHHRRDPNQQVAPLPNNQDDEYTQELVDWLDTIDPEVQTLSTLTNVQNSLFVPDLGNWVNRRPAYVLSEHQMDAHRRRASTEPTHRLEEQKDHEIGQEPLTTEVEPPVMSRSNTITSRLTDSHYAALPHGTTLEGWSAAEKYELDDHVRHMLHSRRSRMKRRLKGFGQYVKRPLGFFVTLYATLITLFGLAWVLFLIGWIYVGDKQLYVIHIIDSVLVALFAIMGDGLAPFRAVDTYHMIYIARYSRMINNAQKGKRPRSRLQKRNIPLEVRESLENDAAELAASQQAQTLLQEPPRPYEPRNSSGQSGDGETEQFPDLEEAKSTDSEEFDPSYLTRAQQKKLAHHQQKFAKSHSFYKPHETYTHYPFPLKYLMAIVILLDCHSCLQISLGACTWGIDYHTRPFALTTVILCVSITCNITAGLLISIGDRKTRKKDVMQLLDRQELTGDAIKIIEEKKRKGQGDSGSLKKEESMNDDDSQQGKLTKSPT